jgi:VCBS repeat-containing protein
MIRMSRNVSILSVMVMMTVTVMATVTVAFATPNEPQNEGSNGQTKVTICHKGHTITVGEPAVAAHGRHGDNITGPCGDEPQPEPTLVLTTQATQEVTLGQPISDTATLSGGDNPTGTITFNVYGPDDADCSGEPAFTSVVDVNGEGDYSSDPFTPPAVGTYRWTAEYSDDANNEAVLSECNAPNEASLVTAPNPTSTTE